MTINPLEIGFFIGFLPMFRNGDNSTLLTAPSQRTLSDYVADQLRQAILTEQFKPNQRLVEQEIAEGMQTSRGPVRDALKILENEGLVVRQSHRGAFVAELNPEDFIEIYTLREALETVAVRFAIKRATARQVDSLEELVRTMSQMAQQDYNQVDATDVDIEFHHTLCRISGHKRVLSAWESLSGQIRIVVLKHRLWNPGDLRDRSVTWHERIVEAMRERNAEKAISELHIHMAASMEWVDKLMKQRSSEAGER
jgi:DNA-binding GntR family transcriptional regulator